MKLSRTLRFMVLLPILCATTAYSHHSFSAVYDGTKQTTVTGVVTQFRFVNPHALMSVNVPDAEGKVTKWVVEFDGRLNLSNYGWTEESIKSGDKVTVTGNPAHETPNRMFFLKLVHANGSELVRGGQRGKDIDEDRRQRALQRNQQK